MRSYLIYGFLLLWPFLVIFIFHSFWLKQKFLVNILAYLPIAIFASLRGYAGTDTENYRIAYDYIGQVGDITVGVDFGFTALMLLASNLGLSFQGFSALQAGLCLFLYCLAGARLDRTEPLFSIGILPVYLLDSTFNGVRYGLAFALAAFLVAYVYERRKKFSGVLLIAPALIHSSLAPIAMLSPIVLGLSAVGAYFVGIEYTLAQFFIGKFDSYSSIYRPSVYSGLVPLLQAFVLLHLAYFKKSGLKIGYNLFTLSIIITFGGYIVSLYTYAGLRLLLLGAFLLGISVAMSIESKDSPKKYIILLYTIAVLNFMRQIFLVGPAGGVLFHPYDFYFEGIF